VNVQLGRAPDNFIERFAVAAFQVLIQEGQRRCASGLDGDSGWYRAESAFALRPVQ
jgi:hypothetical protein